MGDTFHGVITMSSTISMSRRATAFRTAAGTFFALFETTYESNVSPKVPRESCVAFGTAQQVNAWILGAMAACAGGMLRRPGGRFTPLGYLSGWQQELAAPRELPDCAIDLEVSDRFYATIPSPDEWNQKDYPAMAIAILAEHGYTDAATAIATGGKVTLRLHADAAVLAAIYGRTPDGALIAPWRIIRPDYYSCRHLELAVASVGVDHEPALPLLHSTGLSSPHDGSPIYAMQDLDGSVRLHEEWSVVNTFMYNGAVKLECAKEGAGIAAAKALIAAMKREHPPLPDDALLTFDLARINRDYVMEFREHMGALATELDSDGNKVTMSAGAIRQLGAEAKRICAGMRRCATVCLPADEGSVGAFNGRRLDLFAHAA